MDIPAGPPSIETLTLFTWTIYILKITLQFFNSHFFHYCWLLLIQQISRNTIRITESTVGKFSSIQVYLDVVTELLYTVYISKLMVFICGCVPLSLVCWIVTHKASQNVTLFGIREVADIMSQGKLKLEREGPQSSKTGVLLWLLLFGH